ncbi:hypothetical protein FPV67DRAFT_1452260 [Lyophyllum atratum]|nr:hypothetical protein FPV67DRAFT_1452260 [Lyophyllum atratum]
MSVHLDDQVVSQTALVAGLYVVAGVHQAILITEANRAWTLDICTRLNTILVQTSKTTPSRVQPGMSFTSLPPELILKIFHLASFDQPQSFRASLCFISKDWVDIALETLFQHVEIRVRSGTDGPSESGSLPRIDCAHHIKKLTFRVDDDDVAVAANITRPQLGQDFSFPDIFAELAQAATSISVLEFHAPFHSSVPFPSTLFKTFSLSNLTHLAVSRHHGVPIKTIFELCTSLQSLVLDAVFFPLLRRHTKMLNLTHCPLTHFHLNVWSVGLYVEPVFSSVSKSITSLAFGINQPGRLEVALRIVGPRLKSLELHRLDLREALYPPALLGSVLAIGFNCPQLERLALDADFDWSRTPLDLLLALPPSLKVLSISKCRDISAEIVAALRRPEWLPKLAELRVTQLLGTEVSWIEGVRGSFSPFAAVERSIAQQNDGCRRLSPTELSDYLLEHVSLIGMLWTGDVMRSEKRESTLRQLDAPRKLYLSSMHVHDDARRFAQCVYRWLEIKQLVVNYDLSCHVHLIDTLFYWLRREAQRDQSDKTIMKMQVLDTWWKMTKNNENKTKEASIQPVPVGTEKNSPPPRFFKSRLREPRALKIQRGRSDISTVARRHHEESPNPS